MENDVLYLQLSSQREAETYADEQPDGSLLLRRQDNDAVAGLTLINWWKHHGQDSPPDSLHLLEAALEPWASKLAA